MPGKVTLALVLIAIGAIVLLRNVGHFSEGLWQTVLKLWPLILVFIGLEVLLTGRKGGRGVGGGGEGGSGSRSKRGR
ncbi:MAG: hypothetical protein HY671_14620 [Chloroflexi bacterium]|nr:hypothetical protein [Chloroflexota bacterium]